MSTGPFLMYFLAVAFFNAPKYADFMSGLSLVGCARYVPARVHVWMWRPTRLLQALLAAY